MTKSVRGRVVRGALLGATACGLLAAPLAIREAAAKVGVTSATDGDPLGKPPQEAERVLRIGVDVQANELITTSANDRAHLLFLDGSSLTVGPNAQLTIDKFVFDPNTKTGELAINASKGVLRLVGGKISKNGPITITTPANTVGIRGGITILDVKASQTDSIFVFGKDMTVRAAGQTQVATRPSSIITTTLGGPPGLPTILAQGALNAQLASLEGRGGSQGGGGGSGGSGGGARSPDQVALSSGLSAVNSTQSVRIVAPGVPDNFGSGPGPRNRNPNDTISTALSNANQAVQTTAATESERQPQRQQQQPGPQPQPQPSAFDQFLSGAFPFGAADFAKLAFLPNSVATTVNELSNLNLQLATATYNGPVVALINGNRIDGTYQNAWSFGNRNGIATIKIDNTTYGGGSVPNTSLINNTTVFQGSLQSTSGPSGRTADVIGTFLSAPNNPASQQFGVVGFSGPNNYQGVGLFTGTK
ncbi:MAG: FecR domain-containing protein [Rhodospirillales bacterium]|nr:FecR domain-containing protein [Rhodospirillales bacterium]